MNLPSHGTATSAMTSPWQPFREPLHVTVLRTGAIALVIGAVFTIFGGRLARWPFATLVALWPTFGGHWIEVWFLNGLRPRLPIGRAVQAAARIFVWFAAGVLLYEAMRLTAIAILGLRLTRWPALWIAGVAFIAVELTAHLGLVLLRRPNFYNGRG